MYILRSKIVIITNNYQFANIFIFWDIHWIKKSITPYFSLNRHKIECHKIDLSLTK